MTAPGSGTTTPAPAVTADVDASETETPARYRVPKIFWFLLAFVLLIVAGAVAFWFAVPLDVGDDGFG